MLTLLYGCSINRDTTIIALATDFRPFTQDGFYLSPNPYYQGADIVGIIEVTGNSDYFTDLNVESLIETAKQGAINLGADGICDVIITSLYNNSFGRRERILRGTLIKRGVDVVPTQIDSTTKAVKAVAFIRIPNPNVPQQSSSSRPQIEKKHKIILTFRDGSQMTLEDRLSDDMKNKVFEKAYKRIARDLQSGEDAYLSRENYNLLKAWCEEEGMWGQQVTNTLTTLDTMISRQEAQ